MKFSLNRKKSIALFKIKKIMYWFHFFFDSLHKISQQKRLHLLNLITSNLMLRCFWVRISYHLMLLHLYCYAFSLNFFWIQLCLILKINLRFIYRFCSNHFLNSKIFNSKLMFRSFLCHLHQFFYLQLFFRF